MPSVRTRTASGMIPSDTQGLGTGAAHGVSPRWVQEISEPGVTSKGRRRRVSQLTWREGILPSAPILCHPTLRGSGGPQRIRWSCPQRIRWSRPCWGGPSLVYWSNTDLPEHPPRHTQKSCPNSCLGIPSPSRGDTLNEPSQKWKCLLDFIKLDSQINLFFPSEPSYDVFGWCQQHTNATSSVRVSLYSAGTQSGWQESMCLQLHWSQASSPTTSLAVQIFVSS